MREVLFIAIAALLAACSCDRAIAPNPVPDYGSIVQERDVGAFRNANGNWMRISEITIHPMLANGMVGLPETWKRTINDEPSMIRIDLYCDACHFDPRPRPRRPIGGKRYDFGQE